MLFMRFSITPFTSTVNSILTFRSFSFSIIRPLPIFFFFFFNDPAPTEISTFPLHDALPIFVPVARAVDPPAAGEDPRARRHRALDLLGDGLDLGLVGEWPDVRSRVHRVAHLERLEAGHVEIGRAHV